MNSICVKEIVKATNGILLCGEDTVTIRNVMIDSREEQEASLFVPIIGEKTDGHKYVSGALKNGATALFMQKDSAFREEILQKSSEVGASVIAVEDTVAALQRLAAWYRNQFPVPVVGITGSVGKTTTKEMISCALETEKKVLKTIGNKNSQIGLSLMMFYLDSTYDIAVIEMGMSEEGEMEKLSRVARPECAVMTNIGVAHIAQLGSKENIRKEKLGIVNEFSSGSSLILNGNDELLNELATQITHKTITIDCNPASNAVLQETKAVTYGIGEGFDYEAHNIRTTSKGTSFDVHYVKNGEVVRMPVSLQVYGDHNVMNALAAIAVAERYGVSAEQAVRELEAYKPIAMRGQIKEKDGVVWIDDTYNASPDSMKSGVQVLLSLENGTRRIAVLADVLELGEKAEELHREVGTYLGTNTISGKKVDLLVTVGENARYIAEEAEKYGVRTKSFTSNTEAILELKNEIRQGDVLLVKGSRGMKTDEIVKAFTEE